MKKEILNDYDKECLSKVVKPCRDEIRWIKKVKKSLQAQ